MEQERPDRHYNPPVLQTSGAKPEGAFACSPATKPSAQVEQTLSFTTEPSTGNLDPEFNSPSEIVYLRVGPDQRPQHPDHDPICNQPHAEVGVSSSSTLAPSGDLPRPDSTQRPSAKINNLLPIAGGEPSRDFWMRDDPDEKRLEEAFWPTKEAKMKKLLYDAVGRGDKEASLDDLLARLEEMYRKNPEKFLERAGRIVDFARNRTDHGTDYIRPGSERWKRRARWAEACVAIFRFQKPRKRRKQK